MMRTGRLGKFCACAKLTHTNAMTALIAIAAAARPHRNTLMRSLPLPEPGALYTDFRTAKETHA
jgi:hypothetical protein